VKKDYISGMTDSLDLVPIGAFHGKGKRTGVYGAYLLACYNDETEDYETICKIGTGFSDEQVPRRPRPRLTGMVRV
jgi:DNA ligase-1